MDLDPSYINNYASGNLEFEITGKPSWLSVDTSNLKLSGKPTLSFLNVESTLSIKAKDTVTGKSFCGIPLKVKVWN